MGAAHPKKYEIRARNDLHALISMYPLLFFFLLFAKCNSPVFLWFVGFCQAGSTAVAARIAAPSSGV